MKQIWMLVFFLTLLMTSYVFGQDSKTNPRWAVALIPGTFNSIAPGRILADPIKRILDMTPYYSRAVIQALEDQGALVHVVEGLAPAGKFEENGRVALESVTQWYNREAKGLPLILLGHSAGGLYALWMSSQNTLPIKKIVLVSTPLDGVKLVGQVIGETFSSLLQIPSFSWFSFFDWRGLPQVRQADVRAFLARQKIQDDVEILAFGASQEKPRSIFQTRYAEYLSPALTATARLIGETCDGIVEMTSAYSATAQIPRRSGGRATVRFLSDLHMPLEHPEQVLDYRIFIFLGASHTNMILDAQKDIYTRLTTYLD